MRVCKECGSELYFEGLLDSNNEVVVVYEDDAICSNRDCEYGQEVHKLWHIEKNTMFYDIVVKNTMSKALSDKDGHHPHERHPHPTKRRYPAVVIPEYIFGSKPAIEEGED